MTDTKRQRHFRVDIEYDHDCSSLMDDCGNWTLRSFNRRVGLYTSPESMGISEDGIVRNPGLRRKMDVGLAFFVVRYGDEWKIRNNHRIDGILVWENKPSDIGAKTVADRKRDAMFCLNQYNAWANGNCYGFVTVETDEDGNEINDGNVNDSVWGFIVADKEDTLYFLDQACNSIPLGAKVEFSGEASFIADYCDLPFIRDGMKVLTHEQDVSRRAASYGLSSDTPECVVLDFEEDFPHLSVSGMVTSK